MYMWPRYRLKESFKNLIAFHLKKIISIEKKNQTKHIFVPSARYAIANILKCFNFDKISKIAVGPFSNQCIYNSVGFISSPIPSNLELKYDAQLIYHMFGYNYKSNLKTFTIEDSVDTFIFNQKNLFLNKGLFEIVSIPKVTNFCYGSLIYCRKNDDKKKLENFFKKKNKDIKFNLQLYLMMVNDERFDFRKKLDHYEKKLPINIMEFLKFVYFKSLNFEEDLKRKIDIIYDFIDDKPKVLDGKYPSSLSINVPKKMHDEILKKFPYLYKRTINQTFNFTVWNLKRKIFLPINQDITISNVLDLKKFLQKI